MNIEEYLKGSEFTKLDELKNKIISKLGYDADEVKADKEAYEKLDGCCKKQNRAKFYKYNLNRLHF